MDWQEIAKKVMEGYDGATSKAFAAKRAAKDGEKPKFGDESPEEEKLEGPPHSEPDGDEPPADDAGEDGLDEETKRKLMELLEGG